VMPDHHMMNGFVWTPGTGWVEAAAQGPADDLEELMRGRTGPEAESGRRALRRRAARQRRQIRDSVDPAAIQEEALAMAQGGSVRHPWLARRSSTPDRTAPVAPGRLQLPRRPGGTIVIRGGMSTT
jgi:hypothetical protein